MSPAELKLRALIGGIIGLLFSAAFLGLMSALKKMHAKPPGPFEPLQEMIAVFQPDNPGGWITLAGVIIFGLIIGLFTAAVYAARSGAAKELEA